MQPCAPFAALCSSPDSAEALVAGAIGVGVAVLSQRTLRADAPAAVLVSLTAVLGAVGALAGHAHAINGAELGGGGAQAL